MHLIGPDRRSIQELLLFPEFLSVLVVAEVQHLPAPPDGPDPSD